MITPYRIELKQTTTGIITVEAEDEQQARELALSGNGKHGDPIPQNIEIVSVRQLEDQNV